MYRIIIIYDNNVNTQKTNKYLHTYLMFTLIQSKYLLSSHLNPNREIVTVFVPVFDSPNATIVIKLNYDSQNGSNPSNDNCHDEHREVPVPRLLVEHLTNVLILILDKTQLEYYLLKISFTASRDLWSKRRSIK